MEMTPNEIQRNYNAAMDSVHLLVELAAKSTLTTEETDIVSRNKGHLKIMLTKDYWTTEDMKPLQDAAA